MRKLTALAGSVLVLVLAVGGGFWTPKAVWAVCYCDPEEPWQTTPLTWGVGTDCISADNNLRINLNTYIAADCGSAGLSCLGSLVITTACHQISDTSWREDGYRFYKCKTCTVPTAAP